MELEKICRTCLGFAGPLLSIYDGGTSSGNANCIADMLSDVTKMKPKSGDNMPEKVCLSCISEINRCYSFKMKCENSNRTLRQLIPEALPEEELVLKPKVQLVNKFVQTLASPKKKLQTVEVQTIKLESDAKKSTVATKPLVSDKVEQRPESPAKRPKLEVKSIQSTITQYTRNTSKRIKQEPLLKDVPMNSEQEFIVQLETLRTEEIDMPSSTTTTMVQDHATTTIDSNFEIFEEYVYDDDNESYNPTNDVVNYTRLSAEDSQDTFDRMVKDVELSVVNELDSDSAEQEDEGEDEARSKDHVEYHISICGNETDEAKASKEEPNFKSANYHCPHCVMCFVSVKNLNKHVRKKHSMSIVETHAEGQNGKIEDLIEIGIDAAPVTPTADSSTEQKKTKKTAPRKKIPDEPAPAIIESTPKVMNYTCDICKASFALRKSLLFHMRLNACNQKSYSCSECGRVFISEDNLIKHKSTHVLSNACDECHKVFPSKEELSQHMIEEHKRRQRNQCTICMKVFTMLSTLRDHMRTHTGEKPFLCTVCGRGFSQNTNLKQHMLRHSDNKPFKCDECPNSYCTKAEYYSHKRTHTGDQPYKCEFCDARFTSNSSMNKHRRKHTGERPYACDLCPMRFACLNVMKNHRRTHTGEKPYKCAFCPRVFTQKGDCLHHQRSHLRGGANATETAEAAGKAKRTRSSRKKEEEAEQVVQERSVQEELDIVSEEEFQDQEEVTLQTQDTNSSEVEIVELAFE